MATRSRTSFQKRQKEIARMEKQRDKAAKRAQRKLNPTESEESEYLLGEDGLPVLGEDGQPILIDDGSGAEGDADDDSSGRSRRLSRYTLFRQRVSSRSGCSVHGLPPHVSTGRLRWN